MINVLIADDYKLIRQSLAAVINANPAYEVVASAADGNEAYALIDNRQIDMAILDLSMPPGESGLVTLQRIHDYHPTVKTVVLSMHEEAAFVNQALASGALGYVLKSSDETELLAAMKHAYNGQPYLDTHLRLTTTDLRQIAKQAEPPSLTAVNLTRREREILPLVGLGYSNQEIADKLFVTRKTVEAHKTSLMKKLGLASRRELIHFALQHHLIDF